MQMSEMERAAMFSCSGRKQKVDHVVLRFSVRDRGL